MRGKGINYDTGFLPGNHDSRPVFDQAIKRLRAGMRIAEDGGHGHDPASRHVHRGRQAV
jgi:hypothetical protein